MAYFGGHTADWQLSYTLSVLLAGDVSAQSMLPGEAGVNSGALQ